jgi:hypothetical protein
MSDAALNFFTVLYLSISGLCERVLAHSIKRLQSYNNRFYRCHTTSPYLEQEVAQDRSYHSWINLRSSTLFSDLSHFAIHKNFCSSPRPRFRGLIVWTSCICCGWRMRLLNGPTGGP